jgi:probable cytosol aminopeptidase
LKKASKDTLDEIWQLPYHEEYMSLLKSDVADMKNSGGRAGGSITAGLFVTKFAKDTPIAHLDIAGSAWSENGDVLHTKGGTGNSVLMLYKYFENISK